MRTINTKITTERLKSRIPGLFSYMDKDEFKRVTIRTADEKINGCFGEYVEDIKLPTLNNYKLLDDVQCAVADINCNTRSYFSKKGEDVEYYNEKGRKIDNKVSTETENGVSFAVETEHEITSRDIDEGYSWFAPYNAYENIRVDNNLKEKTLFRYYTLPEKYVGEFDYVTMYHDQDVVSYGGTSNAVFVVNDSYKGNTLRFKGVYVAVDTVTEFDENGEIETYCLYYLKTDGLLEVQKADGVTDEEVFKRYNHLLVSETAYEFINDRSWKNIHIYTRPYNSNNINYNVRCDLLRIITSEDSLPRSYFIAQIEQTEGEDTPQFVIGGSIYPTFRMMFPSELEATKQTATCENIGETVTMYSPNNAGTVLTNKQFTTNDFYQIVEENGDRNNVLFVDEITEDEEAIDSEKHIHKVVLNGETLKNHVYVDRPYYTLYDNYDIEVEGEKQEKLRWRIHGRGYETHEAKYILTDVGLLGNINDYIRYKANEMYMVNHGSELEKRGFFSEWDNICNELVGYLDNIRHYNDAMEVLNNVTISIQPIRQHSQYPIYDIVNDNGVIKIYFTDTHYHFDGGFVRKYVATDDDVNKTVVDYHRLLECGESYSYRTIMNVYYKYKKFLNYGYNANFKLFMDLAIGRVEVPEKFIKKYKKVTPYVYLANFRRLYAKLKALSLQCDRDYRNKLDRNGDFDRKACCKCVEFDEMGGELFMEWLKTLETMLQKHAAFFRTCVSDSTKHCINIAVDLVNSYKDMGLVTPVVEEWNIKETYLPGDKVLYDGYMWVRNENEPTSGDENAQDIDDVTQFNYKLWDRYDYDGNTSPEERQYEGLSHLTDLRRYKNYLNGFDDIETPQSGEDWLFYYRKGAVRNIRTETTAYGNICKLEKDEHTGEIYPKDTPAGSEAELNDVVNDLCAYGDVITDITYDTEKRTITFEYVIGAHLKAKLVGKEKDDDQNVLYIWDEYQYDNDDDNDDDDESPFGKGIGTKYTDTYTFEEGGELDKLLKEDEKDENDKLTDTNVICIAEIVKSEDAMFVRGSNLSSVSGYVYSNGERGEGNAADGFRDVYYKYEDIEGFVKTGSGFVGEDGFKPDPKSTEVWYEIASANGKEYITSLRVPKSEYSGEYIPNRNIVKLTKEIRGGEDTFKKYIEGKLDLHFADYKFAFNTSDNIINYKVETDYGGNVYAQGLRSNYQLTRSKHNEFVDFNTIRLEFNHGITHRPKFQNDIFIDRGVAAAFEKHIRLSEVKTLEDMENYSNGGFFTMQES